jgi:hypothetical protein
MEEGSKLEVGDPRRRQLGRAALGTLAVAAIFLVFALAVKQVRGLDHHAPWRDDPYDAVVSFVVFFVPLTAALGIVRISLWRSTLPLPLARVTAVMRGGRVLIGTMLLTVLSDWTSVALQGNHPHLNGTTDVDIALLAVVTALVIAAGVVHLRASRRVRDLRDRSHGTDWFTDLVAAVELHAGQLGPLRVLGVQAARGLDRKVVGALRRRPVTAAVGCASLFGVVLALNTLLRAGAGPAVWLDVAVGGSGMFAFLVAAGAYLGLVGAHRPAAGTRRRIIDAAVIGCASVPVALAFREWLWWIVGASSGGSDRLARLLLTVAVATALIVFASEAVFRVHPARTA